MKKKTLKTELTSFVPLNKRVLVKPYSAPAMQGNIYLPDEAKKQPTYGTIIAKSEDAGDELQIGQIVFYAAYTGIDITINDCKHLAIKIEDLIGVQK